mmetsp:Transcript_23150/g.35504  ORF Transcript_23150/g.35504 Transcript_23150/m.35504 type:complete len:82 (+) Transcript_23150:526-771(+)
MFSRKSAVSFSECAGAIDVILIWLHKSTLSDLQRSGKRQKKFYCGRKHKFGLNCQDVLDAKRKILDISIVYGGAFFGLNCI